MEYLSPYVHSCCINSPFFKKHLGTDWLIVSWAFLFGSIFATICSFGLMVHYLEERDKRGIYDYVCGYVKFIKNMYTFYKLQGVWLFVYLFFCVI